MKDPEIIRCSDFTRTTTIFNKQFTHSRFDG